MIRVENLIKVFGPDPKSILPMLEAGKTKDDIRAETGHTVGVNQVSFDVEPGEFFVIMGLSGSGKSTLLRCINRLIEPTGGKVFVDTEGGEIDVTAANETKLRKIRRENVSMVFQRFGLLPHRTVRKNVAYGLEVQGVEQKKQHDLSQEALEMVGLGQWGDSYPDELSGGMQQRVGLARALATEAPVLLMDEPFSALDPLIKVNMQNELIKLEKQLGRTVLFITHDLDEALKLGHRIAIMEGGRVVQLGTPEEIIVNPKTEYVTDFVEHADPTGVITSGTVAVPLSSPKMSQVKQEGGVKYYAHEGRPDVLFGVSGDGKFEQVIFQGNKVTAKSLREVLDAPPPALRQDDLVLVCPLKFTLKQLLRGRTYSSLPSVVADEDGTFKGVVTERELIRGILEKRGYEQGQAESQSEQTKQAEQVG